MNRLLACEILELDDVFDEATLKRQYRRKALQSHPDRNLNDEAATETFQQINAAYEFLSANVAEASSCSYQDLLFDYLTSLLKGTHLQDVGTQLFYTIAERLTSKCEEKALSMLERLDRPIFLRVYSLLKKSVDVLSLPDEWTAKLDALYEAKTERDQVLVLQPRLEDLFEDHVFRVTLEGHTYYIPLWQHELVYDRPSTGELTVRCEPTLPANMTLDEHNNLHVHVQKRISEIWIDDFVELELCSNKRVKLERKRLFLREHQRVTLKGDGVARPQDREIYDVSKRADIVVHLRLHI